jgi:hypothetical protein
MKTRRVFSTPSPEAAREAMIAAARVGTAEDDMVLIARPDIELSAIPKGRQEARTDFKPALLKGAGLGAVIGLVVGLIASAIPAIGISMAGVAVMIAMGAVVGSWAAALMGSTIPDPVKRQFAGEIDAGKVLLVVDANSDKVDVVEAAVVASGAVKLPFQAPTIAS